MIHRGCLPYATVASQPVTHQLKFFPHKGAKGDLMKSQWLVLCNLHHNVFTVTIIGWLGLGNILLKNSVYPCNGETWRIHFKSHFSCYILHSDSTPLICHKSVNLLLKVQPSGIIPCHKYLQGKSWLAFASYQSQG